MELQDELEDAGELDEEEVEEECEKLRKKLVEDAERGRGGKGEKGGRTKSYQVHELAEAKAKESEKMRRALGLKGGVKDGEEEGDHPMARQERRKRDADLQRAKREGEDERDDGGRSRRYQDD